MYGIPNEVEKIKKKIGKKNIFLIEDCAQSMGSEINNNHLGSFGEIAIYSFGYSKNILIMQLRECSAIMFDCFPNRALRGLPECARDASVCLFRRA